MSALLQEEGSRHRFTAEASDLGWAPGHWPATFVRDDVRWTAGTMRRDADGDVMFVIYIAPPNLSLKVFND